MLNTIRQYRRLFLGILLLLILPSFVVVGAWDLVPSGSNPQAVAEIDGTPITKTELNQVHERRVAELLTQLGGAVRREQLETVAARGATLEQIIQAKLLNDIASDEGLTVSDSRMQQVIAQIPEFQKNGRYDYDQAKLVLQDQGYTPAKFEAELRGQLARELLPYWVSSGAVAPRKLVRRLAQSESEVRVVRLHLLTPAMAGAVEVTEDQINAAYEESRSKFQLPATVDVDVLLLKTEGSAARAESFTNLVFESPESLKPAAEALGLSVVRVRGLSANGTMADPKSVPAEVRSAVASPAALQQLFGEDGPVANEASRRSNTEALEAAPGVLLSMRVEAVQASRIQPLSEVRAALVQRLRDDKAAAKLLEMAEGWRNAPNGSLPGERRLELRRTDSAALQALAPNDKALAGRIANEVFGDQLVRGQRSVVSLGNSVLALELLDQQWAGESAPGVVAQLRPVIELLEQIDRKASLPGVIQAAEGPRGVERFPSRLEPETR